MATLSRRARPTFLSREAIGRAIGDWPIWLHRAHLGWLVGRRYAVIGTIGRRSGQLRRAAVMVLRHDERTGEIFVIAGTPTTNWYRNLQARPAAEVWWGRRRFRPDHRVLRTDEVAELLATIRREHPREARVQCAFFGWSWGADAEELRRLAASLGGVALRPAAVRSPVRPPRVAICEEYPTTDNLEHARLVDVPATIFLAAETRADFERAHAQLARVNPGLAAAWWAVPARTRALSPWCGADELDALTAELRSAPRQTVLLDLESPVWAPRRLVVGVRGLVRGRRALDRLIATALERHEVWSAEWPPALPHRLLGALRLELPPAEVRVYMLYSSLLPTRWRSLLVSRLHRRLASARAGVGVGALATGIGGSERILDVRSFKRDLREARATGAGTVFVYRLGGLTSEHVAALHAIVGRPERAAATPQEQVPNVVCVRR